MLAAAVVLVALDEFEDEDDDEALVEPDEELELPVVPCKAFWIAAVRAELTRLSAASLARLDRPLDNVLLAPNMLSMTAALCAWLWVLCCVWDQ